MKFLEQLLGRLRRHILPHLRPVMNSPSPAIEPVKRPPTDSRWNHGPEACGTHHCSPRLKLAERRVSPIRPVPVCGRCRRGRYRNRGAECGAFQQFPLSRSLHSSKGAPAACRRKYRPAFRSARSHVARVAVFLMQNPQPLRQVSDWLYQRQRVSRQMLPPMVPMFRGTGDATVAAASVSTEKCCCRNCERSIIRSVVAPISTPPSGCGRIPRISATPRRSSTCYGSNSFCRIDGIRSVPPARTRMLPACLARCPIASSTDRGRRSLN